MNSEAGGIIYGNNGACTMPPSKDKILNQDHPMFEHIMGRLDGMESIMGDVRDALVKIALLEERSRGGEKGMERFGGRLDKMDERISVVEKSIAGSGWVGDFAKVALGALIAWAATRGLPGN
jgi:hypothetical protein